MLCRSGTADGGPTGTLTGESEALAMPLGHIAQYELLEPLGEGGMGLVFKARDIRLDRVVALKLLRPELANREEYRKRFAREAQRGAALSHPAIAACLDFGEGSLDPPDLVAEATPGAPGRTLYLVMEYVPGHDLQELIQRDALSIARVLDVAIQVADGLTAAHERGLIHRDLKPANIRMTPEGRVKLLDLGLARVLPTGSFDTAPTLSTMTTEGRLMGTPAYMAPELAGGARADARTDLFSLGVTLYQLVTRQPPFRGATPFEVQAEIAHRTPQPMSRYASEVPDELERVVGKLLEKHPGRRYSSARDVLNDLEALRRRLAGGGVTSAPRARVHARRVLVALGVAGAVALLAWLAPRPHGVRTLAVLPFDNRSGDTRMDFLGTALAQDLVGDFVRDTRLDVASLSTTVAGLARSRDTRELSRGLGVQVLLTGNLAREAGQDVARVELVDGRSGHVTWSNRYPFDPDSALALERLIVNDVGRALTGRRAPPPAGSGAVANASPSAYTLYQKAAALMLNPDDPHGPDRALVLLEQALATDPEFAVAWAEKSEALWKVWKRDGDPDTFRGAQEAADRAIRLDPRLLEARVARAQIYRSTSRYPEAIAELEQVLRANPHWDEALVQLGASERDAGNLDRAEAAFQRAVAARPDYWRNWNTLGALRVKRGDYPGAIDAFARVIRLAPDKNLGYEQTAAVHMLRADFAAAIAAYEQLPDSLREGTLASNIGTAYFFARRLRDAERFDRLAIGFEPRNPTWRENLGDCLARAGRADSARASYRKAAALIEDQLHLDPENVMLRLGWAAVLAKTGDCTAARAALSGIAARVPRDDADAAHLVAKTEAMCDSRERALQSVARAARLGISPALMAAEDEFASLRDDPRFANRASR